MKITVLMENTTSDAALVCEHGLCLFIEYHGKNYLLDAGQSGAFLENAALLQVPVLETEICILSHGHYDHAGGFGAYLGKNKTALIYAMKDAPLEYYSGSGGSIHAIGIPETVLPVYQERFRWVDALTEIADGVFLLPHKTKGLEEIGRRAGLFRMQGEALVPDDFRHEMSLIFDTKNGLVVCNSCSHAGVRNILREVGEAFPEKSVYAFVGGLHMKGTCGGKEICTFSEEEVKALAGELLRQGVKLLHTGHCTGKAGYDLLKTYLGEKARPLTTGSVIVMED